MGTNNFLRGRKRGKNKNVQQQLNRPPVEDLIVNAKEHKVLKKFRKSLENRFKVQIRMPNAKSLDSDVIFVSIQGEESSRDFVKKFLTEKMSTSSSVQSEGEKAVDLIVLSDSESESSSSEESVDISVVDLDSEDDEKSHDSALVKTSSTSSTNQTCVSRKKKRKYMLQSEKKSEVVASGSCEVSSTTDHYVVSKKAKLSDSVLVIEEIAPSNNSLVDFIPLQCESKPIKQETELALKSSLKSEDLERNVRDNDEIIILDTPRPARRLRPIVIDGSNIAYEHGKLSRSYSAKGIKLAIDFFLQRGHSPVTAFVPRFRKHVSPNAAVPTTNAEVFDDLEKKQLVVFTPSRRVQGRCYSSYDDRFIVQLASSNGGVIVSNDNYRDLLGVSDSFREAIETRLLMFCFVGDVFMVPEDPLGRDGPSLLDFLSFPPEDEEADA